MKYELKNADELTIEKVKQIFEDKFKDKYKVYKPKGMIGGNFFVVAKSGWTGATIKLKGQKESKKLVVFGMCPGFAQRLLGMGLIPILILQSTSWKKLLNEVNEFIKNESGLV